MSKVIESVKNDFPESYDFLIRLLIQIFNL